VTRRDPREPGTVYVIRDKLSRNVKIGYTSRTVRQRLRDFATGNPHPMEVLWKGPGTEADETRIHYLLRPSKIAGEWFAPSEVVRIAILLMKGYGVPFVASLELDALRTFVPITGLPLWHRMRRYTAREPYWPQWSTAP
jgi:Meiotically up-regulated gene 113